MGELKHSLFGYNAKEVETAMKSLKADLRYLRQENEKQARQIEDLSRELRKAKAEEELIREAIVDAKHLSKRLVREAKEQATEILFEAERDISEQFVQFETSMTALNDMREHIVDQKERLRQELEEVVERYRRALDDVETQSGTFNQINDDIEDTFDEAENIVTSTKQVIFLPKALPKTQTPAPAQPEVREAKTGDDIPVYSF